MKFAFGNIPGSFVIMNGTLKHIKDMPDRFANRFLSDEWNDMTLSALSTGPSEFFFVKVMMDNSYSAYGPQTMLPYLAPSLEYNPAGPRLIAHVAFTATGGWFHRYTNGTVNWSNEKRSGTELMGAAFHAAVNQVRLENPERKEHCITFVTFGYANTVLMRFENGNCRLCWEGATTQWDGIHPPDHPYLDGEMAGEIARRTKDKWILGENTTLCQTDKTKYFLEWYRGSEAQYFYKLGDDQLHERIGGIIRGEGNNHRTVANAQNMQLKAAMLRNQWL